MDYNQLISDLEITSQELGRAEVLRHDYKTEYDIKAGLDNIKKLKTRIKKLRENLRALIRA